jgi:hypothetical protein
MAETETKAATRKNKVVPAPDTEVVDGYTLNHKGHGKYTIEGQKKEFLSRQDAVNFIGDLVENRRYEEQFGDVLPEGFEMRHRTLMYGGTLLELPMNFHYLPDGAHSPYYDRAYVWGWGRVTGSDIADKQARGFRLVTREDLEAAVEDGSVPDHYLSFLMSVDHGARMVYSDLALMRQPRVLWRQQHAKEDEQVFRRLKMQDEANHEVFDRAGVSTASNPVKNEVTTGLKISGFQG